MRKNLATFLCLFIFTLPTTSQTVIVNQAKPLNKNAGRILRLKEEIKFTDESGDYFFKFPRNLKVSSDGSIFIRDAEQLLQFDSYGKFIRNYFKKGQGPGELEDISNYYLTEKYIIIHNDRPHKILWFNYNGELIKEFRIFQEVGFLQFLLFHNNKYFFKSSGVPITSGEPGIIDVPQIIISLSNDGKNMKELMNFPIKSFVATYGGGRGSVSINEFINVPRQNKFLLISHTPEYLIKTYNVELNKVQMIFKREYKRRKPPPEIKKRGKGSLTFGGKRYEVPYPEYMNDIRELLVYKDHLWVITSTYEEDKGYLVDVFNPEGKYVDNFYLKLADKTTFLTLGFYQIAIWGDSLFHIKRTEEEFYEVIKYKIEYK